VSIRTPHRVCLFCGRTLRLSNEHIIPQWLMDHLGIRDTTISPTVTETASARIVNLRRHPVRAFVAGTVCGTCNNGWMSRLEADVKPILIPLIDDPRRMEALGLHERTTIARWTVKTAAVLNRASAFGSSGNEMSRPVPNGYLTDVMNGRLPSGVAVLGCGYPSSKLLDWLQFGTWMAPSNSIPCGKRTGIGVIKLPWRFGIWCCWLFTIPQMNTVMVSSKKGITFRCGPEIGMSYQSLDSSMIRQHTPVRQFLRDCFGTYF
jgi:hypothetical protein